MLFKIMTMMEGHYHALHVFHYVTTRAVMAAITAFVVALLVAPWIIRRLRAYKLGQVVREDGPRSHHSKTGTPTMGGVIIIIAMAFSMLCWCDMTISCVWQVSLVTLLFAAIGVADDAKKLMLHHSRGIPGMVRLFLETIIALALAWMLYHSSPVAMTGLVIPYSKSMILTIGLWTLLLTPCVIVGSANAVNLTDGLDGLAILPVVMVAVGLGVMAYVSGHTVFAEYLKVPHVAGAQELTIVMASVVGAGLGFLWYNAYPAQVFMGDTGSLALGAVLGATAVVIRQELALFLMGGLFVLETVSVMIQVGSYKLRKKRVFRMAPLHHHFELKGWPEPHVIVRFWIVATIFVLLGLASLKIR